MKTDQNDPARTRRSISAEEREQLLRKLRESDGPQFTRTVYKKDLVAEVYLTAKEFVQANRSWYADFGTDEQKTWFQGEDEPND